MLKGNHISALVRRVQETVDVPESHTSVSQSSVKFEQTRMVLLLDDGFLLEYQPETFKQPP